MALYRTQYIAAWKKFLPGVTVRDFSNPAQSASALTRLSDKQNSPVKLILARAAMETSWITRPN
jgi:type VI secretion system protein ImpL